MVCNFTFYCRWQAKAGCQVTTCKSAQEWFKWPYAEHCWPTIVTNDNLYKNDGNYIQDIKTTRLGDKFSVSNVFFILLFLSYGRIWFESGKYSIWDTIGEWFHTSITGDSCVQLILNVAHNMYPSLEAMDLNVTKLISCILSKCFIR